MILFDNSLIRLEYDPATDILQVAYPDLHAYLLFEIKHCIDILVDMVKIYDIKKLLLDSTASVSSVSDAENWEVARCLVGGLATTRIQKMARVQSVSATATRSRAPIFIRQLKEMQQLPFQMQSFNSRAEALGWLLSA